MKVNMLMLKNTILCFLLVVIGLSLSGLSYAAKNCVFNEDTISEKSFSDNKSIALYQVFSNENEVKGVLTNGNLFSIKYWSCSHYGKHSFMIIGPEMQTIPDELNSQVVHLGRVSLSKVELNLLVKTLENKTLKLSNLPIKLYISSDDYKEFYLQIGIAGEAIFIEIKLYKD